MKFAAISAAAAALIAASAVQAAPLQSHAPGGGDDCFQTRDVESHILLDDHTILLKTRRGVVYRVEMGNSCAAASLPTDPIVTVIRGVDMVCKPIDLDVSVHHVRCIAKSIRRMSPAEVSALPKRLQP